MHKYISAAVFAGLLMGWPAAASGQSGLANFGAIVYRQHCAQCHDGARDRTPQRDVLAGLPPETIVMALLSGVMKPQGDRLGAEEISAIVLFLTGKVSGAAPEAEEPNRWAADAGPIGPAARLRLFRRQAGIRLCTRCADRPCPVGEEARRSSLRPGHRRADAAC